MQTSETEYSAFQLYTCWGIIVIEVNFLFFQGNWVTGTASRVWGWSQPWTYPSARAETYLAPDKWSALLQAEIAWLSLHLSPTALSYYFIWCWWAWTWSCLILWMHWSARRESHSSASRAHELHLCKGHAQLTRCPDWLTPANPIPRHTQPCSLH